MVDKPPRTTRDELLKPIAVAAPESAKPRRSQGSAFDLFIIAICAVLSVLALIAATLFFIGFAENDRGFWHLLSAFALSLCLALLVWFPLLVIGNMARAQIRQRHKLDLSEAFLGIVLTLPWAAAGLLLLPLGGLARIGGIVALASSVVFLLWIFSRSRTPTAKNLEKKQ